MPGYVIALSTPVMNDVPMIDAKPPKDEAAKRRSEMKDTFGRELPPLPNKPR